MNRPKETYWNTRIVSESEEGSLENKRLKKHWNKYMHLKKKQSKKLDKYQDLAWKLTKIKNIKDRNMFIISTFGNVPKMSESVWESVAEVRLYRLWCIWCWQGYWERCWRFEEIRYYLILSEDCQTSGVKMQKHE